MQSIVRNTIVGMWAVCLCWLGGCTQIDEAQSSITVIVDLSKSWLNDESKAQDERVLSQVMTAVVAMTDEAAEDPKNLPVMIRVLAIGDRSLNRAPLCETAYAPKLIGTQKGLVSNRKKLAVFLEDCTKFVLVQRQEMMTDITGAIDSVSRAVVHQRGSYKAVIILSDLKEERRADQTGSFGSLQGTHVLLLYRTLTEDQQNIDTLNKRIADWSKRLEGAGALVNSDTDSFANSDSIERVFK